VHTRRTSFSGFTRRLQLGLQPVAIPDADRQRHLGFLISISLLAAAEAAIASSRM
jgi:hypothetical protein